jgi:NitT/TauT family transport system substrate-binding protein
VPIKLGVFPIAEMLPLYVGKDQGFFSQEGLDLQPITVDNAPAGISAMEAGSINIMYSNAASILLAVEQGLDMRFVAPGSVNGVSPTADVARYLVLQDSDIDKLADLKGKRIGIVALRSLNELYNMASLERVGLKAGDYTVTEVPFPAMGDALLNKQVDALVHVEPFVTILLNTGKVRDLGGSAYYDVQPNLYFAHYAALQRWLDQQGDIGRRFQRAYFTAVDYVNANRTMQGDWAVQYARLPPELKDKVAMPVWRTNMGDEYLTSLRTTRDLMLQYGFLKQNVEIPPLVFK